MELILTGTWYVLVWSILVALVVGAYRWVRSQSPVLAAMLVFGIVARAAIGVALFWISYLDLSLLSEFHAGDGFWQLAPDARDYYDAAVAAYFDLPREGAQADTFAAILSGWFYWVGPSPASGLLLNVGVYVLLCVLVLRLFELPACR